MRTALLWCAAVVSGRPEHMQVDTQCCHIWVLKMCACAAAVGQLGALLVGRVRYPNPTLPAAGRAAGRPEVHLPVQLSNVV